MSEKNMGQAFAEAGKAATGSVSKGGASCAALAEAGKAATGSASKGGASCAALAEAGKAAAGSTSPSAVIGLAFEKMGIRKKQASANSELALKRKANALRKDMLESLQRRGLTERIYADKVEDYLELWWTRAALEADIAERGILIFDARRGLDVENCSISARVRVSAQMDRLYKALGFQELAQRNQAPDGDDDDL